MIKKHGWLETYVIWIDDGDNMMKFYTTLERTTNTPSGNPRFIAHVTDAMPLHQRMDTFKYMFHGHYYSQFIEATYITQEHYKLHYNDEYEVTL